MVKNMLMWIINITCYVMLCYAVLCFIMLYFACAPEVQLATVQQIFIHEISSEHANGHELRIRRAAGAVKSVKTKLQDLPHRFSSTREKTNQK